MNKEDLPEQRGLLQCAFDLSKILLTLPVAALGLTVASLWHDVSSDPESITSGKTPILLIHGSESNQQQFFFFRRALEGTNVGHCFAVNLNKKARRNDENCDVLDYVPPLHRKLLAMRELYQKAGYSMDSVILVGNSMGGLVGAAYCASKQLGKIPVAALISISTPWKGSYLGDLFCSADRFPEKYFRRTSDDRERLIRSFVAVAMRDGIPVYNYGSIFDIHVTPASAQLEELVPTQNRLIDSRNDHLTTMLDWKLAGFIREQWISANTWELKLLESPSVQSTTELT
jgi:pimeloyl-ACP methyl ester carboxylesterase